MRFRGRFPGRCEPLPSSPSPTPYTSALHPTPQPYTLSLSSTPYTPALNLLPQPYTLSVPEWTRRKPVRFRGRFPGRCTRAPGSSGTSDTPSLHGRGQCPRRTGRLGTPAPIHPTPVFVFRVYRRTSLIRSLRTANKWQCGVSVEGSAQHLTRDVQGMGVGADPAPIHPTPA